MPDEQQWRLIKAQLERIKLATLDMSYPLRTDALAILRRAADQIERLNELDGRERR